ncbi:hypothetical protein ZIOFF_053888 [Zingiber officinale]|uniref:Transcription repressor n=2 Tax=Zingiber officinale TaxID=94328 RepID=A0A8J5FTI6_ZINOF|nr:hypothetical protein ZIOFF_053888 [Zingiber officinale]
MGNHRFRVSDMMPSFWFYKLKDAPKSNRSHTIQNAMKLRRCQFQSSPSLPPPLPLPRRASSYISTRERTERLVPHSPINHKASDTYFPVGSPRKSSPNTPRKATIPTTSPSVRDKSGKFEGSEELLELRLPPILTKPVEDHGEKETEQVEPRSPRLGARKQRETFLAESLVVVKSSADPQKDFRESMVEMVMEKDLRRPKELEELLMCYLSLNSRKYHGIILKEFKKIWVALVQHELHL